MWICHGLRSFKERVQGPAFRSPDFTCQSATNEAKLGDVNDDLTEEEDISLVYSELLCSRKENRSFHSLIVHLGLWVRNRLV